MSDRWRRAITVGEEVHLGSAATNVSVRRSDVSSTRGY